MRYFVTIEEMISKKFEVNANSIEEAMKIAEIKYNSGKFVLDPGELVTKQLNVENENGTMVTEWVEF